MIPKLVYLFLSIGISVEEIRVLPTEIGTCNENGKPNFFDFSKLDIFDVDEGVTVANGSVFVLNDVTPPWKV